MTIFRFIETSNWNPLFALSGCVKTVTAKCVGISQLTDNPWKITDAGLDTNGNWVKP
jgi:hypothetical protein